MRTMLLNTVTIKADDETLSTIQELMPDGFSFSTFLPVPEEVTVTPWHIQQWCLSNWGPAQDTKWKLSARTYSVVTRSHGLYYSFYTDTFSACEALTYFASMFPQADIIYTVGSGDDVEPRNYWEDTYVSTDGELLFMEGVEG